MKDFSIFELALQSATIARTEDLGHVAGIARRDFDDRESFICRTNRAGVEYACLMIENALLLRTNRGGRVYAGFKRFSRLQSVIDCYLRIADVSEVVYIFGENDWQPPRHPNVRLIPLRSDFRLARECFVITQSSTLTRAFVAFDESTPDSDSPEESRYWALKTSRGSVVNKLANAVEGVIDWSLAAA